jgi:hypothetical protein
MDYQYIILEDVLSGLFYVTRFGSRRGRGEWAGRKARQVAEALSQKQDKFAGFDSDREQRVLEEWLKATVLRLIERGGADKVMSIRPLHFMTYRVDLPFNWTQLRSVPEFVLYRTGEWLDDRHPPDNAQLWQLGIYPDLTGGHVRKSRELARQSYARHYEWMLQQLRAMIGFRLLDYYLRSRTDIRELRDLRNLKGIEFLKTLALGRQHSCSEVNAATQASASPALSGLEREQANQEWPDDVKIIGNDPALPPFDRLVELLASTQEELREKMLSFFTSCSRRNLDSGLLAGSQRRREDNYYTLGTQMLETLVQLLILRPSDPPASRPLDIYDFVKQLKDRYGIWIDEPPPDLDQSYEARQAAQMNFAALKEKLRQVGFFRAVTDARRMQRLRQQYAPAGDAGNIEGGQDHEAVD